MNSTTPDPTTPARSRPQPDGRRFWPTVTAVASASLMLPFSVTGAAVALPRMAADLGSSVGGAQWLLNAFNIGFAALPLAAGGLADRYGRRRVLLAGIGLVGAMSLLVALAPSMALVDAARAVQGCGAAAVLASGAAVLAHGTSGPRRRLAFGILGTSFGTGLAIGPPVAGALVEGLGWRSVFLLVAGLSVPAGLCATRVPESRSPGVPAVAAVATLPAVPAVPADGPGRPPLDLAGLALFTSGLAALAFGFARATTDGWAAPAPLGLFAAAGLLVLLFAVVELRRADRALFDVRLFGRPEFLAVVCQPFTVTLGFVVLLVYLPTYLQGTAGLGTLDSGLLLLPMTAPVLLLPLVAGRLADRTSVRAVLTAASILIAAGALLLTTLDGGGSWAALALPLLPFGVGVGLAFGVMDNAAVSTVPVERAGAAAGVFNTLRITGESVAVAGAAALLSSLTAARLRAGGLPDGLVTDGGTAASGTMARGTAADLAGRAVVQGQVAPGQRAAVAEAFTGAFHTAGLLLAALSAIGALLTWRALRPSSAPLRPSSAP
ncbi:MFS transporter [Kitasatospora xanthocidica]|uniref:MFS transporter n=1 Tax=Kitasatospora xanthocidica TaxID=83382 RepID=UPI0019BBEF84|nr:MFS transporter [Kitasatospora xanthocidica]GHF39134.1 MFS transporter [Kitasatospora xanthocidica]